MRNLAGGSSAVALPRWGLYAAIAVAVILALTVVGGLAALGGRIGAVEGKASSAARGLDALNDISERVDILSDRVAASRTDLAIIRKLNAKVSAMEDDLAAHTSKDDTATLVAALKRLGSSLESLKGDVADAMRVARDAAQRETEPAAPAVGPADLDRLAERIGAMETRVDELGKGPKTAAAPPSSRVNEEALRQLVRDTVDEQVKQAITEMMSRRRPGGRN